MPSLVRVSTLHGKPCAVVPNGSFISGQVTNWTFSDRQRALKVSVNVVRGADPQRVVELLESTAAAHPGAAKEPSPQVVYATNFSAGAVTFSTSGLDGSP
jgi:potassium-dependent mechanosensitive channel